jgi:hypothetical protein
MPQQPQLDPQEPVVLRTYTVEALATVDVALLTADGIPSALRQPQYTMGDDRAILTVRREDAMRALELLSAHDLR